MIYITKDISIDEKEIKEEFVRASGPGGQNVNKVSTAVQLRFDVRNSSSLPGDVRERLIRIAGNRLTSEGVLIIDARRFRYQERNRRDALDRFMELVRQAARKPKIRRKTQPTPGSRLKRMEAKRHHAEKKNSRQPVSFAD
jgi:ribosome-associated protein